MGRFVHVNGLRLHYLEHSGEGPLLVLMHGLSANAHCFDGLVQAGLSPRFRVLSVDLRGRGLSDKPSSGYSMAEHAADILGLLDTLGPGPVVLGGHSFGALLTLYIASHWPERVSRMLLMDAAGAMHPRVRELIQPSLARLGRRLPSVEAYLAEVRQAPYLDGQWDEALEAYYRADVQENPDGTAQSRVPPQAIAEAVESALGEPWPALLPRAPQPALLLNAPRGWGAPGAPPIVPRELALETARALPDCRYLEVPGNHYTLLFGQQAGHLVEAITGFLSR